MKNKIIERSFFGYVIKERTDNQMICLTDLLSVYDRIRKEKGWPEKSMKHFFDKNSGNYGLVINLVREGELAKDDFSAFIEIVEKQGLLRALKRFGLYKTTGRGSNKTTYCHPYILFTIAVWLNLIFREKMTIWVTDELILNRIDTGGRYDTLSKSVHDHIIPKMESESDKRFIYSNFAKLINRKVFGDRNENLHQIASRNELREINRLQERLTALIEVGYIGSYQDARSYLRQSTI